jgi:hypothetical protein
MRWDAIDKNAPKHSEKRKISVFAWIPTLVEDKWVWLESYWSYQEYHFGFGWDEYTRYLK